MTAKEILSFFEKNENKKNAEGMLRFGIGLKGKLYGIKIPDLRDLAKKIKTDHHLALELWKLDIHEAKMLASMIADKSKIDEKLMESWVLDLYSWDICDQLMMNYFGYSPLAKKKAIEWCVRPEEFVKRAGFVLMARMAVSDKKASDEDFYDFFDYLKSESSDNRNMVKKAVNWAIRQIGKRNLRLNKIMVDLCYELLLKDDKSSRWIANDAIRELTNEKIVERLKK